METPWSKECKCRCIDVYTYIYMHQASECFIFLELSTDENVFLTQLE